MTLSVDASYEHGKFAISSVVLDNGEARSYFLPMRFKVKGITLDTTQVVAEMYAIYAALRCVRKPGEIIFTDNESICLIINQMANANYWRIYSFAQLIIRLCNELKAKVVYIPRTKNKMANDISLNILRGIKNLNKESCILRNKKMGKVVNIPLRYTLTRRCKLFNIYINRDVILKFNGSQCTIPKDSRINKYNGFVYEPSFNWTSIIRRW